MRWSALEAASRRDKWGELLSGVFIQTVYVPAVIGLGVLATLAAGFALLFVLGGVGGLVAICGLPIACIFLAFYAGRNKPTLGVLPTVIGWCVAGAVLVHILGGGYSLLPESERNMRLAITALATLIIPGSATMITGSRYQRTRSQAALFVPVVSWLPAYLWLNYCGFDWFYAIGINL